MGVSEEYIKMRLGAIPDLGYGVPYLGTFCATPEFNSFVDRKGDFYIWTEGETNWCQLERQDQLQEMCGLPVDKLWTKFVTFAGYMIDDYEWLSPEYEGFSWEELWLAFAMLTLYHKEWYNGGWRLRDD